MRPNPFISSFPVAGLLALLPWGNLRADLARDLEPFLDFHCFECHDEATTKGDLDLTSLPFDPTEPGNLSTWEYVFDRVRDGEMPPKKKERPEEKEKAEFLAALKGSLLEVDRAEIREYGRVRGRRLTRVEYEHSLHDLLGIDLPLIDLLPADETGKEFETVAEAQQLSHFHLDKYLAAADLALENAFQRAIRGDQTFRKYYGPRELTANRGGGNYRGPEARNGKTISWPLRIQFYGRMPATRVQASGWYRITIKNLRGINPGPDGSTWGTLRTGAGLSADPVLYYVASVEGTAKARDHVYEAYIRAGHLLEFKPNEATNRFAPSGASGGNVSFRGRDLAKQGYSGLEFDGILLERIYPHGSRQKILESLLPGVPFKNGRPVVKDAGKELRRLMKDFAERAFRRPLGDSELAPYRQIAAAKLAGDGKLHEALRAGYRAILCSPRFLTFVEKPGRLDDHALATRLSYFLWDSLPDAELRAAADRGDLGKPAGIANQVDRMLADPRSGRFIESFTDQWLTLSEIDFTTPDRRYREFDPVVQDSMLQETRSFITELIRKDLSVTNFMKSDFAMLNTRLKTHYRMKDAKVVAGKGLQRVSVPPEGRSGLITHGAIHKVTADGAVTSPVLRGVWVNERILGRHIPPPPPNIPAVEPDIRGATSIRDQLAKHSTSASCAACHAKIDPAGFALETFDPVGQWRTKYGTAKNAAKVDPSGVTPDGREFAGIRDWREIYHARPTLLAEAFASHLLTYATGAPMRFSDREEVRSLVASTKHRDYGLRSILHAAVASEVFRNK